MKTEHANPELFTAISQAQGEIENASKSSTNPHFKSKYADLAEILNTVRPVFSKFGLSLIQSTEFDGSLVSVTTLIAHKGGGYITSVASCVPAKTDAQGVGAATTYLRRYSAAAASGIAQEDDDGQSAAHNEKPIAINSKPKTADEMEVELQLMRQVQAHDRALAEHRESVDFIKDRIAANDLQAAADEWRDLGEDVQRALWLATSKGGIFTTDERKTIKEKLPRATERAA